MQKVLNGRETKNLFSFYTLQKVLVVNYDLRYIELLIMVILHRNSVLPYLLMHLK